MDLFKKINKNVGGDQSITVDKLTKGINAGAKEGTKILMNSHPTKHVDDLHLKGKKKNFF
jgi:hypothetical protein